MLTRMLLWSCLGIAIVVHCGSLNMLIPGHDMECVYLTKHKGDQIECLLSVSSDSGKIDFKIYKPNQELFTEENEISEIEFGPKEVDEDGDYMFCFYNIYSRHETVVSFDYDFTLEGSNADIKQRVKDEKKNFLMRALEQSKQTKSDEEKKKKANYEEKQHQLWDLLKNNIKKVKDDHSDEFQHDEALKKQMLLLSLYFDRIEGYLDAHKNRVRRHHYLQMANNWNVMFFSILICVSIVIASVVQLVMLKGFINGKMSWKVWSF